MGKASFTNSSVSSLALHYLISYSHGSGGEEASFAMYNLSHRGGAFGFLVMGIVFENIGFRRYERTKRNNGAACGGDSLGFKSSMTWGEMGEINFPTIIGINRRRQQTYEAGSSNAT